MTTPCVSIIMNCHNGASYLAQALESVFAQTFQDWEIIFWDNNSTDTSCAIAKSFGPRVRIFSNKNATLALGAARNQALAHATGQYIAFLDCDDVWLPDKLHQQMLVMQSKPSVVLLCTDTENMYGDTILGRVFTTAHPKRGLVYEELMLEQWISMSSALLRHSALQHVAAYGGYFDPNLHVCEEADLFYRLAYFGEVDYVPLALTRRRLHAKSTTFTQWGNLAQETRYILAKHQELFPNYTTRYATVITALTRRAMIQEAVASWQQGQGRKARGMLAPYLWKHTKSTLLYMTTFLPSACFSLVATAYFALPAYFRKG